MGRADYYEPGDHNAACSMCGRKMKASWLEKNWQGMFRCPEHNESRQPQDFVRARPDNMSVPWAQPETDFDILFCDIDGQSAYPGLAIPGCSIPGRTLTTGVSGESFITADSTLYTADSTLITADA